MNFKKLSFFVLLITLVIGKSYSQVNIIPKLFLVSQNVPSGDAGWIITSATTNNAGTDYWKFVSGDGASSMVSPVMDFSGYLNINVALKLQSFGTIASHSDDIMVEYWDGATWSQVGVNLHTTSTSGIQNVSLPYSYSLAKIRITAPNEASSAGARVFSVDITGIVNSCTIPTVQATNVTFSNIALNSLTVNWTNGDGAFRIVKMNTINNFTNLTDGNTYTANTVYGGANEQVIYNGTGTSVDITGLIQNTEYWFRVYEFNCSGSNSLYLNSTSTNNPLNQTTASPCNNATTAATNITFPSVLSNSITLSWTNGDGNYRIVVAKQGAAVAGTPLNGTTYAANANFGSGSTIAANEYVVFNGTGNSVTVSNLTVNTSYYFKVFEYCAPTGNGSESYLLNNPASNNATTLNNIPTSCFEIESILVDACARDLGTPNSYAGGWNYTEGANEMVRFRVGATPLNAYNLNMVNLGNNTWQGIIQDTNTSYITDQLNLSIGAGCGKLIEPPAGIIPAGAKALLITSSITEDWSDLDALGGPRLYFDLQGNSFNGLSDTLYVIYQKFSSSNLGGHFTNTGVGIKTVTMSFSTPVGCSEVVTYNRALLCGDINGNHDGDRVDYAWDNTPTYVNDGCQAPFEPAGVTAVNVNSITDICIGDTLILDGTAVGNYTNLYWSGGSGSFSSPNTLATTYSPAIGESGTVYLFLNAESGSCGSVKDTVEINIHQPPTPTISNDTTICNLGTATLIAGGGNSYLWSNSLTSPNISVNPSSQTTYNVTVTSVYGCKSDTSVTVNVNALPNVIASSDDADNSICKGDTIILSGNNASTYVWDNGVNNGNPFSPLASTIYSVTGTDVNGCENTDQITITVNNPTANAGPNQSIYTNTSTNLAGSATNGSTDISYSWTPANLLVDPNVQNPATVNLTNTTTFILTIHDNITGCNDTAQVTITVTGGNLSITTIASTAICNGDSINLTSYPSGGTGSNTFSWTSVPAGFTSTLQSPKVKPTSTTTYSVTVTDAGGITATANTTITVYQLPAVTASSSDADNTICNGSQITLNGGNASTYVWDNSASNGVAFTPPLGTTKYTVTGTDANGCKDTAQINITVIAVPDVSAGIDTSICKGESVTLTGSGTYGNFYTWSNSVSNGVSFVPTTTQTYTVTATGSNTCVNTAQITVTVNQKPTLTYTTVQAGCGMSNGSATVSASGGTGGYTYLWSANAGSQPTSTATSLGVGTYSVTVSDANCSKDTTVNVNELGAPTVVVTASKNNICTGESVTITASGATTYSWNTTPVQTTSQITVSPTSNTTYSATGTTAGCSGSDSETITVHDKPIVAANSDATNNTVCEGESIQLYGSANVTCGYTWSDNINDNIAFSPVAGNYTYTVTGIDNNTLCSNTSTITITVNAKPDFTVTPTSTDICEESSVTINATLGYIYTIDNGGSVNSSFIPSIGIHNYSITAEDPITGCRDTKQTTISVSTKPYVDLGVASPICQGDSVILVAGPPTGYTYLWNTLDTTSIIHIFDAGTYSVVKSNTCPDAATDSIDVVVYDLPVIDLPTDTTNSDGYMTVVLNAGNFSNYVWSNSAITQSIEVSSSGTYYVTVTDENGCQSSKVVVVTISDFVIHPYNTITPNGDAINDKWIIENIEFFPKAEVMIFNRNGNKVFEATRYNNEKNFWDGKFNGKELPAASYYYIIDLGDGSMIYKGHVSIVR